MAKKSTFLVSKPIVLVVAKLFVYVKKRKGNNFWKCNSRTETIYLMRDKCIKMMSWIL